MSQYALSAQSSNPYMNTVWPQQKVPALLTDVRNLIARLDDVDQHLHRGKRPLSLEVPLEHPCGRRKGVHAKMRV